MPPPRLAELLGSLSLACDLANGFAPAKVLRSVILAVELGRRAGLPASALRDTYWVSLLRYLGCTAFAHEEAHAYGAGDDINTRSVMALADAADPVGTLRSIARGIGKEGTPARRARAIVKILAGNTAMLDHAHAQCEAALRLADIVGFGEELKASLAQICERYDGLGVPKGLAGDALTLPMRLSHIADVVEIAHHRDGRPAALEALKKRRGKHFDPELAAIFLGDAHELFSAIEGPDTWQHYLELEPLPYAAAGPAREDDVALAFAYFVDQKSTYTLGHSTGVAALAAAAARALALPSEEVSALYRAALLHDVGRVSVPTGIWDKPGALSVPEWERVRLHTYYTERVLNASPVLRALAPLAAASHERANGAGYHRGLPLGLLERGARLLAAADTYHALCEPRAHRPARSRDDARRVLLDELKSGLLDRESVNAVLEAAGHKAARGKSAAPAGLTEREVEVLRLLARGLSNKEIGVALAITTRTAQHHVEHIYGKIGVCSRASAALFATQHGLLGLAL